MSVETDKVPPVPNAQEIIAKEPGSNKVSIPWMQWFQQLRAKVNVLDESFINLAGVTGTGILKKLGSAWTLIDSPVTPGTYGSSTEAVVLTVDGDGIVTAVTTEPISGGGGGGAAFAGALLQRSTDQAIANNTNVVLSWTSALYQEGFTFWNVASPTRFTIPPGVLLVRITAQIRFNASATGERALMVWKNGLAPYPGYGRALANSVAATQESGMFVSTAVIPVITGDYFDIQTFQTSGASRNMIATNSWAQIEVLKTGAVVSFISSSGVTYAVSTSYALTLPSDIVDNDLIVIYVMARSSVTTPTGWTLVDLAPTGGSSQDTLVFTKIAVSGDASSIVTFIQVDNNRIAARAAVFRKTSGGTIAVTSVSSIDNGLAYPFVIAPITSTQNGAMAVVGMTFPSSGTTAINPPVGTTGLPPTGSVADHRLGVAYKSLDAGQTISGSFTNGFGTSTEYSAITILIY